MNDYEKKLIELFSKLWADLEVPVSVGMPLGPAKETWMQIKDALDLHGWLSAAEVNASALDYCEMEARRAK